MKIAASCHLSCGKRCTWVTCDDVKVSIQCIEFVCKFSKWSSEFVNFGGKGLQEHWVYTTTLCGRSV